MKKLSFLGSGPKIAIILLPWLAASIFLTLNFSKIFSIAQSEDWIDFLDGAGIVFLATGIIFYFFTVPYLRKGLKETRLVTSGPYYICRNPLYCAILLFMIPGLALIENSWLILTSSLAGYIAFKLFIRKETAELEEFFGEEYRKYCRETPEFFPLGDWKKNPL